MERRDLIFYAVPLGLAIAAGVLGLRAYRAAHAPAADSAYVVRDACAQGRYRCRNGVIEETTGDRLVSGACAYTAGKRCVKACASSRIELVGTDQSAAEKQLCDPPKRPKALLTDLQSFLDQNAATARHCEDDGYIPTDDGLLQCVRRPETGQSVDGVVIGIAKCRFGPVVTLERKPQLVPIEEAAAVWCKRDPGGEIDFDEVEAGVPSIADGGSADAAADAIDASFSDAPRIDAATSAAAADAVVDGG